MNKFLLLASISLLASSSSGLLAEEPLTIQVPPAVKKTLEREAAGGPLLDFSRGDCDGKTVYDATIKIDGKEYSVRVDANGKLDRIDLKDQACDESEPTLDKFPEAVKNSLLKFASGNEIKEVEKCTQKTSFTAKILQDGQKFRITVDETGRLVSKERVDE